MKPYLGFLFAILALICAVHLSSAASIVNDNQEGLQLILEDAEDDILPENKLLQPIDEEKDDDDNEAGIAEKDSNYADDDADNDADNDDADNDDADNDDDDNADNDDDDNEENALEKSNIQYAVLVPKNNDNEAIELEKVEGRDLRVVRRRHRGGRRGNRRRRRGRRNRRGRLNRRFRRLRNRFN